MHCPPTFLSDVIDDSDKTINEKSGLQVQKLGMFKRRLGVGAAGAALAVVLVFAALVAGLVVARLPAQQSPGAESVTQTSATSSGSNSSATRSQTSTVTDTTTISGAQTCPTLPGTSYSSANITYIVPTCTTYSFPGALTQIEVLNSSKVLPYVERAYNYSVVYVKDLTSATDYVLNVTGRLEVAGNWTTGYDLSYTGNKLLNITVLSEPGHPVSSVLVDSLPDRHVSITFTRQQQSIIQTALSNSTVQALMIDPPYFVVTEYPGAGPQNGTDTVLFQQVQGILGVAVDLNASTMAVLDASNGSYAGVFCDSNGLCVTDPWNVEPDAGVSVSPFLLTIAYSGQWTADVTAYNNGVPSPKSLLYSKTFTGTGDQNITIPWQSVVDGMTVTAKVQKSDGGTSTLTATMNWTGGDDPDSESTNVNSTSVTVGSSVLA